MAVTHSNALQVNFTKLYKYPEIHFMKQLSDLMMKVIIGKKI